MLNQPREITGTIIDLKTKTCGRRARLYVSENGPILLSETYTQVYILSPHGQSDIFLLHSGFQTQRVLSYTAPLDSCCQAHTVCVDPAFVICSHTVYHIWLCCGVFRSPGLKCDILSKTQLFSAPRSLTAHGSEILCVSEG